jgi:integrase
MAKVSETSITKKDALKHLSEAKTMSELACKRIIGFHLIKTQRGGTWRLRYTDFTGKRRKVSLRKFIDGTKERTDAVELAIKYRNELKAGTDPVQAIQSKKKRFIEQQATLQDRLFHNYLNGTYADYQTTKRGGKKTLATLRSAFPEFNTSPMDEITANGLKQWCSRYIVGRNVTTVERTYTTLRAMLYHALDNEVISTVQFKGFKIPKRSAQQADKDLDSEELAKRRMLTDEEKAKIKIGLDKYTTDLINTDLLLKKLNYPHWFFPFFRIAEYTGLRPGDIYSLTWTEVNLNFKVIRKHPNKTRHYNNPVEVVLPLDDDITESLRLWHMQNSKPSTGLVFPDPKTGEELTNTKHLVHWKKVMLLGGFEQEMDFYALRHNFISKLIRANVPLPTIAKLAGHKTTKMIEQHYHHLLPKAAAEALALIAGDFSKSDERIKGNENAG